MIFIKSSKYFKIIYIYGNDKNYSKKRLTCIFYSPENTKFVINNTDVLLLGQTNRLQPYFVTKNLTNGRQ